MGAQHQLVEAVVLHLAGGDLLIGLVEDLLHLRELDLGAVGRLHAEIMQPHGLARIAEPQLERVLGEDAQAHMLQRRQHVREGERAAGDIELEAQLLGRGFDRAVEVDREPALGQRRFGVLDVEHRGLGGEALAIAEREGVGIAPQQRETALLAMGLDQGFLEMVGPGAPGLHQPRLDLAEVHLRHGARRGLDHDVEPRQVLVGHLGVEGAEPAIECLGQDLLHAQPELGVEPVARQIDEAGDEALEGVAPREERDALTLLQMEDSQRRVEELVGRHLEELVAREALQDVKQGLAVVARRVEAGPRHAVLHLAPEDRDVARAAAVGGGGEEADEELLAHHLAGGVEALHPHRVHLHGPVHGGLAVGLGHHQQARLVQEIAHVGRQPLGVAQPVEDRDAVVAQDAEAAAGNDRGRRLLPLADEVVVPAAEEGEVVVDEPLQEGPRLGHLLGGQRRRRAVELGHRLARLGQHRLPVGDRDPHILQHALDVAADLLEALRVALLGDADLHEGFVARRAALGHLAGGVALHLDDWVDHEEDGEIGAAELGGDRIHQEGHVVVDDLDDGMRAVPAVLVDPRVEDPDLGLTRPALLAVVPERERGAVEVLRLLAHQIVRGDVGVELPDEALRRFRPRPVQALGGQRRGLVDQLGLVLLGLAPHGPLLAVLDSRAG